VRAAALVLVAALAVPVTVEADQIERRVLPNGLRVLVRESPGAGVVAIVLLARSGSLFETEANSGVTNFLQRMMLRGTKARSAVDVAQAAEDLGATLEAAGDVEYAELRAEGLARNWEALLALVAEVVLEPAFLPEEIETERRLLLGQIQTRADTPVSYAMDVLMKDLFGNHPYALHPLGERASVERIAREQLRARYASVYRADRMVLVVTGAVPSDRVVKASRRLFGKVPRSRGGDDGEPPPPGLPLGSHRVVEQSAQQAQILMGYLTPGLADTDYAAIRVLGAVVGGGMSGRLFVDLREQRGLAYAVGTMTPYRTGAGLFVAHAGTAPVSAEAAETLMRAAFERARVEDVTPDELARAKAYLLGNLLMDRRTNARQAWYLGFFELMGAGWQFPERHARDLERVSAADVMAAARRYLVRPTVVVLHPPR